MEKDVGSWPVDQHYKNCFKIQTEEKGGRETPMCGCLSHTPSRGTWPTTQACALTGNRTSDPLFRRLVLNPLSHTSHSDKKLKDLLVISLKTVLILQ